MPELPEVETIRRQLSFEIIGKKLFDKEIINVRRRAKILIIDFKDKTSLIFHLKLTGQLIFNGKPSRYTPEALRRGKKNVHILRPRKVFNFNDGSQLIFNDLRKFGWYKTVKNLKEIEKNFGPEATEITFQELKKKLQERPLSKIKNLLMDQKFIAGIGNIYSDEILFFSEILPFRLVKTLTEKEIRKIYQETRKILKKAIKYQGSSVGNYFDAYGRKGDFGKYHKVYRKTGQKCSSCGTIIKKIKQAGRHAHFCPKCQQ